METENLLLKAKVKHFASHGKKEIQFNMDE
jgi:hypothetical protein